jgi:pilus assembly protein Flp/PilA
MAMMKAFFADEDGATAIEYGLIATLLAIALVAAFTSFGSGLSGLFNFVSNRSSSAMAGG